MLITLILLVISYSIAGTCIVYFMNRLLKDFLGTPELDFEIRCIRWMIRAYKHNLELGEMLERVIRPYY